MAISLTRLSGGNTPADGSDPRTFPAIWNASATAIEGALADTGASVTVSETAPVSPSEGDLWLNSTEAKMYVYYDDGSSEQWVAAVGGTVPQQGKILQVVQGTTTTQADIASTSFTSTGISFSITPSSASSKVLILGAVAGTMETSTTAGTRQTQVELLRGATQVEYWPGFINSKSGSGSQNLGGLWSVVFLDEPATTSAVTYTLNARVNATGDSTSCRFQPSSTPSIFQVMEVAG